MYNIIYNIQLKNNNNYLNEMEKQFKKQKEKKGKKIQFLEVNNEMR